MTHRDLLKELLSLIDSPLMAGIRMSEFSWLPVVTRIREQATLIDEQAADRREQ